MRVLSVLIDGTEGPWGESLGRAQALWRALQESGHEVFGISDSESAASIDPKGLGIDSKNLIQIPGATRGAIAWARGGLLGIKTVKKIQPDVIVAHGVHSAVFARQAKRANPGMRWIVDLPNFEDVDQPVAGEGLTRFLARPALREADEVITVSSAMRRLVRNIRGSKSIAVVPDGVDVSRFRPCMGDEKPVLRDKISPGAEHIVVCQGQLAHAHNPLILIDAARSIVAEHPKTAFWIIGEGPAEAELRRRVVRNGLSEKFVFTGNLPHHLLASYIRNADLGIVTMPDRPGASVQLAPSAFRFWSAGIPVIFPDSPALSEVTTGARVGKTYSAGDRDSLARATSEVLSDHRGRQAMSEQARGLMLGRFRWDILGAHMASIVEGADFSKARPSVDTRHPMPNSFGSRLKF